MKRIHTLYRVSTKKQVDKEKNDIPMQRLACKEFAEQQGWVITREFEEKGVSGFKVSANSRDAIQDLKEAAIKHEFDVLLVFMFDRIGRIDDETPFVVEWFVKHGIEVWSVKEGEQRFDSHVDKLTNYIRFWQASGESEKTSMRIKTRKAQLTLEGCYTGGTVPYGYQLIRKGRLNKKGNEMRDLAIEPAEAEIVREIFNKTIHEGYGSYRIADMLNKRDLRTHSGSKFQCNTIIRILRNRLYCGYIVSGNVTSEALSELTIIESDIFDQAQYILDQRAEKDTQKRQIAFTTKGQALLSGNVFCAHCGGKLTTIRYKDKYTRRDGSEHSVDQIKYSCYHRSRKLCKCDGQATYQSERIDAAVIQIMHDIFDKMTGAPDEDRLKAMIKRQTVGRQAKQRKLSLELQKNKAQLEKLQLEIANVLTGNSLFSPEDLSSSITTMKGRIAAAKTELHELEQSEFQQRQSIAKILPAYNQFKSWADEFDSATKEQKKMIACQLFKRIEIGRNYAITCELNMTYQQFCEEWSNTEISKKMAI